MMLNCTKVETAEESMSLSKRYFCEVPILADVHIFSCYSSADRGRYTYHIEGQFHFGFILFP